MAINEMPNSSVSQDIADALHYASDHLPVSVNIVFSNDIVSVNQPPVANDTIFSVNEFPQDKTQIGKISAYDPENESLSYNIISGNNQNIFSIDDEGNMVVEHGSLLDYDLKNSYLLVIQVSDGELKTNLQLTIRIIDSPPLLLEVKNLNSIQLKPNPVEEILYVTLDNSNFKNYFIRSINGNVLLSDDIIKNQFEINLRYIPDGTYIFEAISDNNKSVIKVIKKGS
jgi:hypothetical protein